MEHHLLTPHISPLITGGGTCVADREYVASRLADAGLKYMFVGHSHMQSTTDFKSKKRQRYQRGKRRLSCRISRTYS